MRIPKDPAARLAFYRELVEQCSVSRETRIQRYSERRAWYLYGTVEGDVSPWNRIFSHLDTVSSFLYASDSTRFTVKLNSLAPDSDRKSVGPFSKLLNEKWKSANSDIIFQQAILWSLVYDSSFVKHIRRGPEIAPYYVDPGSIGVYREDVPMLDRQEAIVHFYYITKSDLHNQLALHPRREEIVKSVDSTLTKKEVSTSVPSIVDRVILNGISPLQTVTGQATVNVSAPPDYSAQLAVPVVEMQELWVWDNDLRDYRTVTLAGNKAVVYDRQNIFLQRIAGFSPEHPFVQVCPNPLPDYFWGESEVARLAPLQERRNKRMADIQRLLQKQVDPPTGWYGMGLSEEKIAAFDSPGSFVVGDDPSIRRESFVPTMPPDVYADIREIDAEFDQVSGLTNTLTGKGESGVRSAGHAQRLMSVGSSRPKKRALIIEDSLEKSAGLFGKLTYIADPDELKDDDGQKFVVSQLSPHFSVEVDAHSNSPVFAEDSMAKAEILLKAGCIDRETFIRMVAPAMQDDLVFRLNNKIIPGEQAAAQAKAQAEAQQSGGKPGEGG